MVAKATNSRWHPLTLVADVPHGRCDNLLRICNLFEIVKRKDVMRITTLLLEGANDKCELVVVLRRGSFEKALKRRNKYALQKD